MDRTSDDFSNTDPTDAELDAELDAEEAAVEAELDDELGDDRVAGRRGHVETASLVAIALGIAAALHTLASLWNVFTSENFAGSTQGRLLQSAGSVQIAVVVLLVAAVLVSVHRALAGGGGAHTTRATAVVGGVAAALAALQLAAVVATFRETEGMEGVQVWAIRTTFLLAATAAGSAFFLVTGDRE